MGIVSLAPQIGDRLRAVGYSMDVTGTAITRQYLFGQVSVRGLVVHQQNLGCSHACAACAGSGCMGKVNLKQEPGWACASIQIFPPCRSTIFLQIDSPIPFPAYSVRVCRRRKTTKMSSRLSTGM